MKRKITSLVLSGLISAGVCCSVVPKAKALDGEDCLEIATVIAGGALGLGIIVGVPALIIGGAILCVRSGGTAVITTVDRQAEFFGRLRNYGISIANQVSDAGAPCNNQRAIAEFDRHLTNYLNSVPNLGYFNLDLRRSSVERVITNCRYYNEVRFMIKHLDTTIRYLQSYPSAVECVSNLNGLKAEMNDILQANYRQYEVSRQYSSLSPIY